MNFKVGQLVQLVSGSPVMTVIGVSQDGSQVTVYWVFNIQSNSVELPAACFKAVA